MTYVATTPLEVAREHLRDELQRSDHAGDGRYQLIGALYDVADMVCRIGDHWDSRHYQAGKSQTLVDAALGVRRDAFVRYCGDSEEPVLYEATKLVGELESLVTRFMWSREPFAVRFTRSDAADLRRALSEFTAWAAGVIANAVDDPED
jgi:hypothetical protein